MATNSLPANYRQYNGYPKTMYTDRTRSKLQSTAPKSNSAMSTRTYSRIKSGSGRKSSDGGRELRKSLTFEDPRSPQALQLDDSVAGLQELENEQELLKRMIDQQKQLQELRDRQKRVLELQQQLASMEMNAETSMEEKLSKLKTAKTRLDELQKLVGTIKSAETSKGSGDSPVKTATDKNEQVRMALDELNELKMLINMMSSEPEKYTRPPVVTLEPVFPNSIGAEEENEQEDVNYQSVLPEVSVIQYTDEQEESPGPSYSQRRSSKSKKSKSSGNSKPARALSPYRTQSGSARKSPYSKSQNDSTRKKTKIVRTKSPSKSEENESSERLWDEMRRHQLLLEELRDRRKELEDLMNMTNQSRGREEDEEEDNDTNASIRSNLGSPDESRGVSDSEPNNFETSQSDRLFGLNETDTRRLIDLIRNQKTLGATTEKTTATWGSSSTESSEVSEDENVDNSRVVENENLEYENASQIQQKSSRKPVNENQNNSMVATTFRDAFTQLDNEKEHEIDFRPPTRRRRNITQQSTSPNADSHPLSGNVQKLQDDLLSSNATMHLLLEDQKALSKLLLNTLNLQQTSVSSNLCYGISPDFLIYQLDNCSAQFATILKETKEMYWQLYGLTKDSVNRITEKPGAAQATRTPLATLSYVPEPLNTLYQNQDSFALQQAQIPSKATRLANAPYLTEGGDFEQQPSEVERYTTVQRDPSEASVDGAGNDLFEALRDSIYSEAAILISQNEARPHFLIELFHSLQQLDTDYLRQHALYVLQDVMKGYIPASPRKGDKEDKKSPSGYRRNRRNIKKGSFSENTPSESAATSEDELYAKLKARASADTGYDFSLKVSSASELSTPSGEGTETNPFAADDLGSTVIHLDAALRHMREMERMKQEILSSANIGQRVMSDQATGGAKKPDKNEVPQLNTKLLRARIKHIVSEVIPLLKANHDKTLDLKLVKVLQCKIVECVGKGMDGNKKLPNGFPENGEGDDVDKLSMESFFSGQLNSILNDSFKKFVGQRVGSCGEDLVVGLSEVLFNELAFFYMMQDLDKGKQDAFKMKGVPTIRIEPEEEAGGEESNSQEEGEIEDDLDEDGGDSEVSNGVDVADSESRDKIDTNDSSKKSPVTVDLSVSETKPLTSYGSGEDEEEEGSGDDYEYQEPDVPTSMQHDADEAAVKEENDAEDKSEENQNVENENTENNSEVDDSEKKT